MNIELTWNSEDKLVGKKSSEIISFLKRSQFIMSSLSFEKEFSIESPSLPINKSTTFSSLNISPNKEISLSISPTKEVIAQIKNLLMLDEKKELQFSKLKQTLLKLKENTGIKSSSLKRKLYSLVHKKSNYYMKLIDNLLEKFLQFDKAKKELKEVEGNMMKFKTSIIINIYYKIVVERINDSLNYLMRYGKYLIGNSHDENVKVIVEGYQYIVRTISSEANLDLTNKLKNNQIYKDHEPEYHELFTMIEKILELFPVLKHIDTKCPKVVFSSLDPPKKIQQSETIFKIIANILSQLPSYDEMKEKFANFKKDDSNKESLEMAFIRDSKIYARFETLSLDYIYASLLYDD